MIPTSKTILAIAAFLMPASASWAGGDLEYKIEAQMTIGQGDNNPLWLNANKYGLSSVDKDNGYFRAALTRPIAQDSLRKWGIGYGVDLAAAYNNTSSFIVQQAYFEGRWRKGLLTIGSKQQPMEMKNQELSTGSQVFGINARPVPQVRVELPDYIEVPYTRHWLQFKGHLAYGRFTDDSWQKDFTNRQHHYTEDVLYHGKAGFLRLAKPGSSFSVEAGIEMACQFGGKAYGFKEDGFGRKNINPVTFKSFMRALIPGGNDGDVEEPDKPYQGTEGNHVGAWLLRLTYDQPTWAVSIYGDHYFEDISAMFLLDYDNYTTGSKWMEKHGHRFLLYDLRDILLGAELKLKYNRWLNDAVVEYIYTKYQSGPIYFDHKMYLPDHIGGRDNYYQHYLYSGWQHWGQVMGNPLYRSPLYNTDGDIQTQDNRFYAFHLGLSGNPLPNLHYRLLCTVQKGFGSYKRPFDDPQRNFSLLAEATYRVPERMAKGWGIRLGIGLDRGELLGDNFGVQLTITKSGAFSF